MRGAHSSKEADLRETVLYEKNGGVATIALNRPDKLNAFDERMHEELHEVLDDAATGDEIRCVVLRGEGRGPSAGADLRKEAVGQALCGRTADHEEGVAAFFGKREPNFTGR
jgi:enoyl-CoA hydratase/carnithine racemase